MSIITYITNKTCYQHSYGFQNIMFSCWSWSKCSKLQWVGDFYFVVSKMSFKFVYKIGHIDHLYM